MIFFGWSEYSEDTFKMEFGRTLTCLQKYSKACILDYEEFGDLSDQGHGTAHMA
jgi:hypothetical protein